MARTRLDDEVLDLLAGEPELRAIADAVAETQTRRRRVRPVGVAVGVAVLAAAALAFAFWSGGGSSGISGNTAYAGVGGGARLLAHRGCHRAGARGAPVRPGAWSARRRPARAGRSASTWRTFRPRRRRSRRRCAAASAPTSAWR